MEGVDRVINSDEGMDAFEYFVDGFVPASTVPPSLNNSLVVTVNGEVPASCASTEEVADKTLEANSFRPSNVPLSM